MLGGCAVVSVCADGGKASLSAYPLGVRVDRGTTAAVRVDAVSVGLVQGPLMDAAGVSVSHYVVADPTRCAAVFSGKPDRKMAEEVGEVCGLRGRQ